MPKVSVAFLTVGALCGLAGMLWGGWMGVHEDFLMAPAHAHLNLLGWVTLAIMGLYYSHPPASSAGRLAWVNFILSAGGVIIIIPLLYYLLSHQQLGAQIGPWMLIPEAMVFLGLATFLFNVIRSRAKPAA
jgi:hypothetical protein